MIAPILAGAADAIWNTQEDRAYRFKLDDQHRECTLQLHAKAKTHQAAWMASWENRILPIQSFR